MKGRGGRKTWKRTRREAKGEGEGGATGAGLTPLQPFSTDRPSRSQGLINVNARWCKHRAHAHVTPPPADTPAVCSLLGRKASSM